MANNDEIMALLQDISARLAKLETIQADSINLSSVSVLNITTGSASSISIENLSELHFKADNGSTLANTSIEIQGEVESVNTVTNGSNSNITLHCNDIAGEVTVETVKCDDISGEVNTDSMACNEISGDVTAENIEN